MKQIISFVILVLTVLSTTTGLAHTMPESELFLQDIGPGATLAQVKNTYGEPVSKKEFKGDGVRVITYVYSPRFSVTGRTYAEDTSAEEKLKVVAYSVKDKNVTTPSGFSVSMPYQKILKKFGEGEKFTDYDGRIGYIYSFNNGITTLTFYVDPNDIITEITLGTDF